MQKLFISIAVVILFMGALFSPAIAKGDPHPRYKVVTVKPVHHKRAHRPAHIKRGHVWIEGHWVWHQRSRKYVWVEGRVVKKKPHKTWVSGHWRQVRGGWVYVPGFWA